MRILLAIVLGSLALQEKPGLLPEPDANAQKETLKAIKDLFKDEYAKKNPSDQAALAQEFLRKGIETNDNLPSQYVFLKEARDLSMGAGDADTVLRAAYDLGKTFAVDGFALKVGHQGEIPDEQQTEHHLDRCQKKRSERLNRWEIGA